MGTNRVASARTQRRGGRSAEHWPEQKLCGPGAGAHGQSERAAVAECRPRAPGQQWREGLRRAAGVRMDSPRPKSELRFLLQAGAPGLTKRELELLGAVEPASLGTGAKTTSLCPEVLRLGMRDLGVGSRLWVTLDARIKRQHVTLEAVHARDDRQTEGVRCQVDRKVTVREMDGKK